VYFEEGENPEDHITSAYNTITNAQNAIRELEELEKNVQGFGIVATDEERRNVRQQIAVLQKELNEATRFAIMASPEFDEMAEQGKNMSMDGLSQTTRDNVNALKYDLGDNYKAMTEREKNLYFYYLANGMEDKANEYLADITNDVNGMIPHRVQEQAQARDVEYAQQGAAEAAWAYGSSFGINVLGNVQGWLTMAKYWLNGTENWDPNGSGFSLSNKTQALRQGVNEYIVNEVGKYNAEVLNFFLNAITSAGDSTINALLTTGAFNLIGKAVPAAQKLIGFLESAQAGNYGKLVKFGANAVSDWSHAVPMALSAANNAYRDAIANNASPEQAEAMFAATFWAESVSEAITVGNIKDMWEN
jgi:hypothetical protein